MHVGTARHRAAAVADACTAASAAAPLPLQALPVGGHAVIEHLRQPADADDREVLLRLIELGFLPGEPVQVVAKSRGGREPIAVRVGGQSTFALRAREAALVGVRALERAP